MPERRSSACGRSSDWTLHISAIILVVLGFFAIYSDIVIGKIGVRIGGWYTTLAIFPELLLCLMYVLLGLVVRKDSKVAMVLFFVLAASVIPIMMWEVMVHFHL